MENPHLALYAPVEDGNPAERRAMNNKLRYPIEKCLEGFGDENNLIPRDVLILAYKAFDGDMRGKILLAEAHLLLCSDAGDRHGLRSPLLRSILGESAFLSGKTESLKRLARVSHLIEGFETPYGMELLATVHWVAHHGGPKSGTPASGPDAAVEQIHAWNPRKQELFRQGHVHTAWSQLSEQGWMQV